MKSPDEDDENPDASEDEDPIELLDQLMAADPAPLPPVAPDGGFSPQIAGEPAPIPEATVQTCICMAGPCRWYMQLLTFFPSGNTEGSPGYDARQWVRYCDVLRSAHISLAEELVYECNRWEPISDVEKKRRAGAAKKLVQIRKNFKKGA